MEAMLASLTLAGILAYLWYVSLIKKRNTATEALAVIDAQLKKRAAVLPNILTMAQKYMGNDKTLLTEISALRTRMFDAYDHQDAQAVRQHLTEVDTLGSKVGQLLLSVESHPELKRDQSVMEAMQTYNELEAHICAARRFYNSAVSELNSAVAIFPGSLIARMASVNGMPFFEALSADKAQIKAGDLRK